MRPGAAAGPQNGVRPPLPPPRTWNPLADRGAVRFGHASPSVPLSLPAWLLSSSHTQCDNFLDSQVGRSPGSALSPALTPNPRPVRAKLRASGFPSLPRGTSAQTPPTLRAEMAWDLGQTLLAVTQSHPLSWKDGVNGP
ncbi:unnamed protein product [Pipistrellus nathusii]|uniref:Uncharacterized protein n=1 Tax=Pipistrellus nathusii TaxID=59473 RepID=A0ABP0AHY3_PIPNA